MTNETESATGGPLKKRGGDFLGKLSLNSLTTLDSIYSCFLLWLLFGFDFVVTRKTCLPVFGMASKKVFQMLWWK